ncbi:threonine synthase [Fulvivirgaceae bacterium BMA10]|uniref:Threonine synthase n=1 Tax=Splendidivirga corallicola TaxID=3051826 RepID=A0ABT8KKR8_9BACT|nr:threonine synthase [Fulvivirgaceae bacterium BMA10]
MRVVQDISHISYLQCSKCNQSYEVERINTFSTCCHKPLLAKYEFLTEISKHELKERESSMWRYFEMLPVLNKENIISLGEGMTPILPLQRLGDLYGMPNLWLKDESLNPTGSFKARGLSMAVSKAKELGVDTCIIPTAGNAGGALSAYCARAGIKAVVVMPSHTPAVFKQECKFYDAELILVDGLISDCGRKVAEIKKERDCFDVSTLKEPYRIEGKKTMGYEIAEQGNWELPDVILYPTGGGTGLIGIWKAFYEMQELGWIDDKFPKMIAVQAENCQPIVETLNGSQENARNYKGKASLANGLAVPNPFGEDLILEILQESNGTALGISDMEMINGVKDIAKHEGTLIAPEGGALLKAAQKLIDNHFIRPDEKILLLNTGSGYKYLENMI